MATDRNRSMDLEGETMPRMTEIALDTAHGASNRRGPIESAAHTRSRLERLEAEVIEPTRRQTTVESRLRHVVSSYAALAIEDPGTMSLFADDDDQGVAAPRPPAVRERVDRFLEMLEDDLAEVFRAQGRASRVDPRVAALSLLGLIHWGIRSHQTERRLSRAEAIAQVTFLALHGLTPGASTHGPLRPAGRRSTAACRGPA